VVRPAAEALLLHFPAVRIVQLSIFTGKNHQPMDHHWEAFVNQWNRQLEDAKHILRFLYTYPHFAGAMGIEELNTAVSLESLQKEWLDCVIPDK